MIKIIKFYKEIDRWYADLPDYISGGGKKEDLEMISGADDWLEMLSNGSNSITLKLSQEQVLTGKLLRMDIDSFGATYILHEYLDVIYNELVWLCNVTKWVFGVYPKTLYFSIYTDID
jgi:hypothetical protein